MDEMTIHRKRRLNALIQGKPYLGSQLAFARATGLSEGRISQLAGLKEAFGERSAKAIQEKLGLEERFFEKGYESAAPLEAAPVQPLDAEEQEVLMMLRTMAPDLRKIAIDGVRGIYQGRAKPPRPSTGESPRARLAKKLPDLLDQQPQETTDEAVRHKDVRKG